MAVVVILLLLLVLSREDGTSGEAQGRPVVRPWGGPSRTPAAVGAGAAAGPAPEVHSVTPIRLTDNPDGPIACVGTPEEQRACLNSQEDAQSARQLSQWQAGQNAFLVSTLGPVGAGIAVPLSIAEKFVFAGRHSQPDVVTEQGGLTQAEFASAGPVSGGRVVRGLTKGEIAAKYRTKSNGGRLVGRK